MAKKRKARNGRKHRGRRGHLPQNNAIRRVSQRCGGLMAVEILTSSKQPKAIRNAVRKTNLRKLAVDYCEAPTYKQGARKQFRLGMRGK